MEQLEVHDIEFLTPKTEDELLDILDRYKEKAKVLAGGSDLLLLIRRNLIARPNYIVNIMEIPSLKYINEDEETVRIGATVTHTEAIENQIINREFPSLVKALKTIGSTQIRNWATIAGNLANASPAADSAPILIALDAKLKIKSAKDEKIIPVEELFVGVKKTILKPNEIIKEIIIPKKRKNFAADFIKLGKRNALVLAVVSAAAGIEMSEDGKIKNIRIALGSVAPTPLRAKKAEDVLRGKEPKMDLIDKCAKVAKEESKPISDVRASAEYRREMVYVLTKRVILNALKELGVDVE
ncbi:MAG: xanthine dehydrogenase family protein subunit M [Candidatus Asgardarchaeum sp.]